MSFKNIFNSLHESRMDKNCGTIFFRHERLKRWFATETPRTIGKSHLTKKKCIPSSVNEKSALSCAQLFLLFAVALSQEACE